MNSMQLQHEFQEELRNNGISQKAEDLWAMIQADYRQGEDDLLTAFDPFDRRLPALLRRQAE